MATSKHEFIKIELRLFENPRYFTLSDFDQLNFIKLIMLAKRNNNKIPKNWEHIKLCFRSKRPATDIQESINRITREFRVSSNRGTRDGDVICQDRYTIWFRDWQERYNYGGVDKEKDKDKEKDTSSSKKKPYYRNQEMRQVKGKWFVIPANGGEWLEFAGKKEDITYK